MKIQEFLTSKIVGWISSISYSVISYLGMKEFITYGAHSNILVEILSILAGLTALRVFLVYYEVRREEI